MKTEPMSLKPREEQIPKPPVYRSHAFVWFCLIALSVLVTACGEDEDSEATAESSATVKATATSSSQKTKTSDSSEETATQKRKKERAKKREELAEKRRATAKASAEARKKAINEAAQAQSGRKPIKPITKGEKDSVSGSKTTEGRRVVQRATTPANITPLNIERILALPDVKQLTGMKRLTDLGPLVGIPQSEMYNSRYMAPPKRSTFGVSVQVWKETLMRDMNERYSRMRRDYPNVTDTNAVTPKGFFSYWNDLMTLVFMDFQKKLLVAVSCSTKVCSPEKLYELAKRAKEQL